MKQHLRGSQMSTELLATFTTKDVTKPCHCSSNLNSKPGDQGCHKGRNWRKKLPSGRPFRPDVRGRRPDVHARPRLPRGRGKNRVRADAAQRPHGRSCASTRTRARPRGCKKKIKNKKYIFF
jgi:hypothetical protein